MALIPKTELALRINEWLSILRVRAQHTLSKHHILHTAQKGGLPHLGTEDAIMAIINAIEDSHEHQNNLHILSSHMTNVKRSIAPFEWQASTWHTDE